MVNKKGRNTLGSRLCMLAAIADRSLLCAIRTALHTQLDPVRVEPQP